MSSKSLMMIVVLDTLLIMIEIQNFAHMFGDTYDHKLFGQLVKGPTKPSVGGRMKGVYRPHILVKKIPISLFGLKLKNKGTLFF